MGKTRHSKNTQELTRLLKRIGRGEDPRLLRKDATRLMNSINPHDIAIAEQSLIENGYPAQFVEQLSAAFMLIGIIEEQGINLKENLKQNHILRLVIAEHDLLRCYIADLEEISKAIYDNKELSDVSADFRRLSHIIEHLDAMEEHIEREEDVIFPYLKKYGWSSLCRAAQNDHVYIKIAISDLIELITSFNKKKNKEFKVRLNSITKYLCPILKEHIFQEENILYPIALEVIKEEKVWDRMKNICDEIGYCGTHI